MRGGYFNWRRVAGDADAAGNISAGSTTTTTSTWVRAAIMHEIIPDYAQRPAGIG